MSTITLDPHTVLLNPDNPPSRTADTTDLQESIRVAGQIESIKVIPYFNEDPKIQYLVVDGNRRTVACRQLGIQVAAQVLTGVEPEIISAASSVQKELTPLEKAKILTALETLGHPTTKARAAMGMTAKAALAYKRLLKAPEAVQKKVEDGKMSISAYSHIAMLTHDEQIAAVGGKKRITVTAARTSKREIMRKRAKRMLDDNSLLTGKVTCAANDLAIVKLAAPYGESILDSLEKSVSVVYELVTDILGSINETRV